MPGLRLTEAQVQRLWGLDPALFSALLSTLIDTRFLFRTREGAFMRIEHAPPPTESQPGLANQGVHRRIIDAWSRLLGRGLAVAAVAAPAAASR
jgi:hypothetical protein